MSRSVDVGLPDAVVRFCLAGWALLLLLWGGLAVAQVFVGRIDLTERPLVVPVFAVSWLLLTGIWIRLADG